MSAAFAGDVAVRPLSRAAVKALDTLPIRRLVSDSRAVQPGDTFVAYPGDARDGRHYIGQAIARGAASVLWERRGFTWDPAWKVPNIGVLALRRRAGEIASQVYGRPSAKLWMIGVTGTNGKTSCSHWIAQSLTRTGRKCAVIGTLGSGFPGRLDPAPNTTPDALTLHGALRDFVRASARAASMEVSSHGLVQHRLSGVEFDVALLTNLTRDHLDFHSNMEQYFQAKRRLFDMLPRDRPSLLNVDDPRGAALAEIVGRPVTFAIAGPADITPGGAGVRAQAVAEDGSLVDDFRIAQSKDAIHVLNAPSPAATASLAIGRHIAGLAREAFALA